MNALWVVNCFSLGRKSLIYEELTVPEELAPANSVPAAAVIRRVQALSGITGFKGCVGGYKSQQVKFHSLTVGTAFDTV